MTPRKRTRRVRRAEGIWQRGPKTSDTFDIIVPLGRDPRTGKKRDAWQTFKGTLRAAKVKRGELIAARQAGAYVEPSRLTVAEYLKGWLADHARHAVSAKTFERYSEIVNKHLVPALGAHRLAKLAPLHIQAYHGSALANGRLRRRKGEEGERGLSARTVKFHHKILSQALRQAVRLRLLTRNPCDDVKPPRAVQREMNILDHEATGRLLREAEHLAIYMPVLLAVTTGMRRGEILALRWRDVDLDARTLAVRQTLEQTKAGGLAFKAPKTARGRRTITLPELTAEALRRHRTAQKEARLKVGPDFKDHDLVCALRDGNPRSPLALTNEFARLIKRLGLAIRFHDLRHTHISHLLAAGVHPKVASERAGHASVAITMDVYSHVLPGMQEDAANRIDAALRTHLEH